MLSPCATCTQRCPILEEPTRSPIMILSDYAGENELRRGRPMVGRAGAELDRVYLSRAGLSRSDVYVTNAYKCPNPKKTPPKPDIVATCAEHWLPWEIRRVQPEYLIVAGSTALKLFKGRHLDMHHGRPFKGSLYRDFHGQKESYWSGTVWPTYNPAAGLRSPDFMTPLLQDFWEFGRFYRNPSKWRDNLPVDPYPDPDYRLLRGRSQVSAYLESTPNVYPVFERPGMGMDTETEPATDPGSPDLPHCLSFSTHPGTGAVILADDLDGLFSLYEWMEFFNPLLYIHNGLFDLPVLDRLRMPPTITRMFRTNRRPWIDTMIQAYHQRSIAIALKILSYRELGADMLTFDDVVLPPSIEQLSQWLELVINHERVEKTHGKNGRPLKHPKVSSGWDQYRLPRQTGIDKTAAKLREKLLDWVESSEESQWEALESGLDDDGDDIIAESEDLKSPWNKIKGWPENLLQPVIEIYGPPPIKSIAHVPLEMKVHYACRDSDMALRLGIGLLEQRANARLINA